MPRLDRRVVAPRSCRPVTPVKKAAAVSTLQISLPRDATSPGEARRRVLGYAKENKVEDPAVVLLVVSELVTNAVLHGLDPIEVRASFDGDVLRIEVSDSDPDVTAVVAPQTTPNRVGGRGLQIVDSVTRRWGTTRRDHGKTVWAEFSRADLSALGSTDSRGYEPAE
jgi:anti-sigma regulatory factor (Ser/Thr protein kinase)